MIFITLLPRFPRCFAFGPKFVEQRLFPQRVHALPKRAVLEADELAIGGELLEWLALPHGVVAGGVVENLPFEDEECAVDPALAPPPLLCGPAYVLATCPIH